MKRLWLLAVTVATLTGCDDSTTSPEGTAPLTLRFATAANPLGAGADATADAVVTGEDGVLVIDDIKLIVSEFELEGDEDACDLGGDDDDCEEFESDPFLLDLPLTGAPITVATTNVRAGTYHELEFEVEDLDDDDGEGDGDPVLLAGILEEIRTSYPDFPRDASMVVHGSFTPTSGVAREFTVYFDAEIEIEMDLVPALEVPGDEFVTIVVDPLAWFSTDGEPIDLSAFDGEVLEFEAEIEDGFDHVEHDDDDPEDDD